MYCPTIPEMVTCLNSLNVFEVRNHSYRLLEAMHRGDFLSGVTGYLILAAVPYWQGLHGRLGFRIYDLHVWSEQVPPPIVQREEGS